MQYSTVLDRLPQGLLGLRVPMVGPLGGRLHSLGAGGRFGRPRVRLRRHVQHLVAGSTLQFKGALFVSIGAAGNAAYARLPKSAGWLRHGLVGIPWNLLPVLWLEFNRQTRNEQGPNRRPARSSCPLCVTRCHSCHLSQSISQ